MKNIADALILGIESSCDETSVAFVRGGTEVIDSAVASQIRIHERFGGVVPEVACRAHMEILLPSLQELMENNNITGDDIDAIAVTNRPGLIGALLIGVSAAKGLALAWDKPLIGVNHIEAHITAAKLIEPEITYPYVALVVSGGHTAVFLVKSNEEYILTGTTRDDAAGEAFDKAAAILDLSYPGGPSIEKAAKEGNPKAYHWKNSCLTKDGTTFSFSGIKTAVLYAARGQKGSRKDPLLLDKQGISDVAASFQRAAVHALVSRTIDRAIEHKVEWIAVGGGVAANSYLREELVKAADQNGIKTAIPPFNLCTDNAIMIAARGAELLKSGKIDDLNLTTAAREMPSGS
ncbi:MAG: tRNA (adenosine(37)-N6)-threonylcarbamoyltransferase complex transferase subunit TsaD [Planctomycetota bacterium]|jgi:N6-L-threonylcarbamoyladenine synthase